MRSTRNEHCSLLARIWLMMLTISLVTPSAFARGPALGIRFETSLRSVVIVVAAMRAWSAASMPTEMLVVDLDMMYGRRLI